jgi:putative colanic acid biosynthesis acetyltransferase WcaF
LRSFLCLAALKIIACASVAKEVYLHTGTHDLCDPRYPLQTTPIDFGANAIICARTFLLPSVRIGKQGIVGACAEETFNVPPVAIVACNTARLLNAVSNA